MFIGKSTSDIYEPYSAVSSATGQALDPTNGVVLILAPAALSNQLNTFQVNGVGNSISQTYNNGVADSAASNPLFNPYAQPASQTSYNISFTSELQGPAWTFYGLSGNEQYQSNSNITDPNGSSNMTSTPGRKVFVDFNGNQNNHLAKDIRQVYFPAPSTSSSSTISRIIDADKSSINGLNNIAWTYSSIDPAPIPRSITGSLATYKSWKTLYSSSIMPTYYLPLAGTWPGDNSINAPSFQMVPNYEGLSLNAEWTSVGPLTGAQSTGPS
jgi:hypothetical protein